MPVTIKLNEHGAEALKSSLFSPGQTAIEVLRKAADTATTVESYQHLFKTSLDPKNLPNLISTSNGFIHAAKQAYSTHQHLVIRPDDVWITILTQFSLYVAANAEKMRRYFVQYEGKKELNIDMREVGPDNASYEWMAAQLCEKMDQHLNDRELKTWILCDFSTTTPVDKAVSAIMMMCTLQAYFAFKVSFMCGIPSITLAGTREDWAKLYTRIAKLLSFGDAKEHPHLHAWHSVLSPVLKNFVDAFDATPERTEEIRTFWNHICKIKHIGSGSPDMTGWLTYFAAFDEYGKWQLYKAPKDDELFNIFTAAISKSAKIEWAGSIDADRIPGAYAEVPLKMDDNEWERNAAIVAGMAGYMVTGENKDTISPHPAYWVFEVDAAKMEEEKKKKEERGMRLKDVFWSDLR